MSPAAKRLASILKIDEIFDPEFWAEAPNDTRMPERWQTVRFHLRFVRNNLPMVLSLLERESDALRQAPAKEGAELAGLAKFTLILPEENLLSSTKRISTALDGVAELYTSICTLRSVDSSSLAIVACDSGSDKVFDFAGLGEVLRELKELLLEVWDRTVYFRQKSLKENIAIVADALPVLKEIEALKVQGAIPPEQAELLKRGITKGITKFVDAGAMIPEMARVTQTDMRALAAPSPRLLAAPQVGEASNGDVADEDVDCPTDEET